MKLGRAVSTNPAGYGLTGDWKEAEVLRAEALVRSEIKKRLDLESPGSSVPFTKCHVTLGDR